MNKLSNITKTVTALFILVILAACNSSPAEPTSEAALEPQSFNGFSKWHEFFCIDNEYCEKGDVNGDGKDDIVTFVQSRADTIVALSNGSSFNSPRVWTYSGCASGQACRMGDVNGDGRADAIIFERNNDNPILRGAVFVQLSNGSSFGYKQRWNDVNGYDFCTGGEGCYVGDLNGDGKDDIISFVGNSQSGSAYGDVYAALSTGTSFGTTYKRHDYFCTLNSTAVCDVGDFNGDGRADIVAFYRNASGSLRGDVYVALSNGSIYGPSSKWHDFFCINEETCAVGNVAGSSSDNRDDIIAFVHRDSGSGGTNSRVLTAQSTGSSFSSFVAVQLSGFCFFKGSMCMAGNFNGSGKEDLVSFVRDTFSGSGQGDVYVALAQ
jgi:FG-GAP-like repeat